MELSSRAVAALAIGLVLGILLVVVSLVSLNRKKAVPPPQSIQEVSLTREETSITLTRGGTLTVRTPEGVFQQQWDEERVRAFFEKFERADLSLFRDSSPGFQGYIITFVSAGGGTQTFYLPFGDISLPEGVKEIVQTFEQIVASSQSGATPTPTPTPFFSRPPAVPTPTPRVILPTPTPTPIPPRGGIIQKLFECEFTDPSEKPDILSQTVCTILY